MTASKKSAEWYDGIESVVSNPMRFKAGLCIGEDAYTSLKIKNAVTDLWDVAGAAASGAGIATSSLVASTFFSKGLLAIVGIGTAATPIGWVIAAAVATGGAWYGLTRKLKQATSERVTVVPNFINTPLDVLAIGLFDLMVPLALKVAEVDGEIHESERRHIRKYLIDEWGYSDKFCDAGVENIESELQNYSIKYSAETLAEFAKKNPDCNFARMSEEIVSFLHQIMEADDRIDEREEMAIERISAAFKEANKFSFSGDY